MKSVLHAIAAVALVLTWAATVYVIYGPHPLPDRIPVHFDAAGSSNGWGSPAMLWLLPIMATVIYLLMTVVARFPSAFNFPVRVTRQNRPRLEALALAMIAWLRAEVVCLFAWIQYTTLEFARQGQGRLSPWFLPLSLVAVFLTIGWHVAAMLRVDAAA
jgi:uncharacterized membrane protein